MTPDEMDSYASVRDEVVRQAVTAADRMILGGCRGNAEVLMLLTAEVALRFNEKIAMMARQQVFKMEMLCEVPPEVLNYGH
jgi:hypothetical protein